MKAFLRAVSGVLLVVMLLTLTLWRNDAFPDLSRVTQFLQDAQGLKETFTQIQSQVQSNGIAALGERPTDSNGEFPDYELSQEIDPALEAVICEGMLNHSSKIDISALGLSETGLQQVVTEIRFTHPELFFGDKTFAYNKNAGGVVQTLEPRYTTADKAQTDLMMAEYELMLSAIVAGVPADGTDFDKILYIHDYFVREYCYDKTLTIRDAYTFFKQKTGLSPQKYRDTTLRED